MKTASCPGGTLAAGILFGAVAVWDSGYIKGANKIMGYASKTADGVTFTVSAAMAASMADGSLLAAIVSGVTAAALPANNSHPLA